MPSSATITAFYNFSANTKARASQVNANFDIFRGHLIPVDPLTATSSNSNYDLGSTEYRWRNAYVNKINFLSNTTTGNSLEIIGVTSGASASPGFLFQVSGSTYMQIGGPTIVETTSAARCGFAKSAMINYSTATAASPFENVPNSTCTISTTGRPVLVSLVTGYEEYTSGTGGFYGNAAAGNIRVLFLRNNVSISSVYSNSPTTTVSNFMPASLFFVDDNVPAGTYNYSIGVTGADPRITYCKLAVREI